jgi:hypothetical protein
VKLGRGHALWRNAPWALLLRSWLAAISCGHRWRAREETSASSVSKRPFASNRSRSSGARADSSA